MKERGLYWEKGYLAGYRIIFPANQDSDISFGTVKEECKILVPGDAYLYLCVGYCRYRDEYMIIVGDFEGPFLPAKSGYVIEIQNERIRLL